MTAPIEDNELREQLRSIKSSVRVRNSISEIVSINEHVIDQITQLITRKETEARLDQLDQLIDIESMTFNKWKPKDVAHFFDVVVKQYRELEQKLK